VIQAYESSIPFARDYVTRILPAVCGGISVAGQKDRPDLTQGAWASANPKAQHSGGEVTLSCRRNGAEMRGQVVADTCIYPLRQTSAVPPGRWICSPATSRRPTATPPRAL